jgi:hypothetical protein
MDIGQHVLGAFEAGTSVSIHGKIVGTLEEFEQTCLEHEEKQAEHALDNESNSANTTGAVDSMLGGKLRAANELNKTLTEEKKGLSDSLELMRLASKACFDVLRVFIPKDVADLKELDPAKVQAVASLFDISSEGDQLLTDVIASVHAEVPAIVVETPAAKPKAAPKAPKPAAKPKAEAVAKAPPIL